MKSTCIRDRIAAELRRRQFVTYDDLFAVFAPDRPDMSKRLREARRAAVVRNVSRARKVLADEGLIVQSVWANRRYALRVVRLPRHTVDDQTFAELTIGQEHTA